MKNNPTHVSFIMDGNRRWAKKNKLKIFFGHKKGTDIIEPLVNFANERGIKYLTFWAFSSENWKRGEEVSILMDVFRQTLKEPWIERLMKNNVKISVVGKIDDFPQDIQKSINKLIQETEMNSSIELVFALNYGGRMEIINAVNEIVKNGIKDINEEKFNQFLYTKNLPDPDLIIRTGGERRLSGFMPYQSVYSELYFTDLLWPDFSIHEFETALEDYASRDRRFGK